MKQLIYSTGVFETELKVWPPEEVDDYDCGRGPWRAIQRNPRFQVRKTSHCLMRYEIEEGEDIARKCGQISGNLIGSVLTSEDLY